MDIISIITIVIISLIVAAVVWQIRQKPFVNVPEPNEAEKNLPVEYYYPELKETLIADVVEEITVKREIEQLPEIETKTTSTAKKTSAKPKTKAPKKKKDA